MKEEILKQIKEDTSKGLTQVTVDNFWQDVKHKGWKTELMLDVDSFPEEKVDDINPEIFLEEMRNHPEKWHMVSYRHTLKDNNDANVLKRLLVMVEITKHVDNIKSYEELIEFVFEQDCLHHATTGGYGNAINGSMHVAAYLMCCLGKIENVFKVWRSKNTSFESSIIQHAEYLYIVGYTPESKTSANDTIEFVTNCDANKYPEKESLLERIAYDTRNNWRTQAHLNTFWARRQVPGFWNFARLIDGGWG
eukprot:Phypoly_transcript_15675.p1 GENE.Phypoly_transcript_15675~~Phypoly_transcript_15675.p1  ORF type:complete len:294 (+),score=50.47 Phypoly_transcript_15675:135-884(+)